MSETESGGIGEAPLGQWVESERGLVRRRAQFDRVTVWERPDGSDRYVLEVIEKGVRAVAVLPTAQAARIAHLLTAAEAGAPVPDTGGALAASRPEPQADDWPAAAAAEPWWRDLAIWGAAIGVGLALGIALSKIALSKIVLA